MICDANHGDAKTAEHAESDGESPMAVHHDRERPVPLFFQHVHQTFLICTEPPRLARILRANGVPVASIPLPPTEAEPV